MRLGFSIVLLTAYLVAAPAHSAVDTHYSDLFDKGVLEYRSGQSIQASETLRLACFGMLSDPARLTECFVHLALAQDAANDRSGFDRTWDSLTEVERLFPSYANANLDETDRRAFEAALQRSVSPSELSRWPVFSSAPPSTLADDLSSLGPKKRRRELERRAATEPGEPKWPFMLAEMDASKGKTKAARARLDDILRAHSGHSPSRCLATELAVDARDDEAVAAHFAGCESLAASGPLVDGILGALDRQGLWDEAVALFAGLDPAAASRVQPAELAARLAELLPKLEPTSRPATPTESGADEPEAPDAVTAEDDAAAAEESATSGSDVMSTSTAKPAELERLRQLANTAPDADALDRILRDAADLADGYPSDSEAQLLAGEVAYRGSSWAEAAYYFGRAGEISRSRPLLLFYQAVSLYETGRRPEAEESLRKCVSRLSRTPYVQSYIDKILPGAF